MKNKPQHIVSLFIGLVLVLSGIGKALNVLGFQQLIHSYGFPYLDLIAPVIILAEILLGTLFIARESLKTLSLWTAVMILVFTGVYTLGYIRQGITDCGCFGVANIPELPVWAVYLRNVILLLLLNYLYFSCDNQHALWTRAKYIAAAAFIAADIFLTGMTFRPAAFLPPKVHPLEGKAVSETALADRIHSDGSALVLCYSYSCSHCLNSMENFLAMKRYERVDTIIPVALVPDNEIDSVRNHFRQLYPQVNGLEMPATSMPEIEQFPTALLIENDTIRQVLIGELPNPYFIETNKTKNTKQ